MAGTRVGVVLLLLGGAFFAAAPWLGCALILPFWRVDAGSLRLCTFGIAGFTLPGYGVPGFTGPYWGNLVVGILYVAAAIFVARRRRPL